MHGSLPFLVPTGPGPVLCLSSSEAEEAVQEEEEEAHLRLVVPGMLQLSRYLAMHKRTWGQGLEWGKTSVHVEVGARLALPEDAVQAVDLLVGATRGFFPLGLLRRHGWWGLD